MRSLARGIEYLTKAARSVKSASAKVPTWLSVFGTFWSVLWLINHYRKLPREIAAFFPGIDEKVTFVLSVAAALSPLARHLRRLREACKLLMPWGSAFYSLAAKPYHSHVSPLTFELLSMSSALANGVGVGSVDFSDPVFERALNDSERTSTAYPEYLYYWLLASFLANHAHRVTRICMAHYFPSRGLMFDFVVLFIAAQRRRPAACQVTKVYRFPSRFDYSQKDFGAESSNGPARVRPPQPYRWYREIHWAALLVEEYHAGSKVLVVQTDQDAPRVGDEIREVSVVEISRSLLSRPLRLVAEGLKEPTNFDFRGGRFRLAHGDEPPKEVNEAITALENETKRLADAPWQPRDLEYAAASAHNIWYYTKHGDEICAFDSPGNENELLEWHLPGTARWLVRHACQGAIQKGLVYQKTGEPNQLIRVRRILVIADRLGSDGLKELLLAVWVQEMVGIKLRVATQTSYQSSFSKVESVLKGFPDYVVISGRDGRCKCVGWRPRSLWYPTRQQAWPEGVSLDKDPREHFEDVWNMAKPWQELLASGCDVAWVEGQRTAWETALKDADSEAFSDWSSGWTEALNDVINAVMQGRRNNVIAGVGGIHGPGSVGKKKDQV